MYTKIFLEIWNERTYVCPTALKIWWWEEENVCLHFSRIIFEPHIPKRHRLSDLSLSSLCARTCSLSVWWRRPCCKWLADRRVVTRPQPCPVPSGTFLLLLTLLCQERRAVYCTTNVLYSAVRRLPQLFAVGRIDIILITFPIENRSLI